MEPLFLKNTWKAIKAFDKRLERERKSRGRILQAIFGIWRNIEEQINKRRHEFDAILFETPEPRYDLPFGGVGNIIYALSERLKYEYMKPLQHISEKTPYENVYIDAHIHHYIFHGLGGILFDVDKEWVFNDISDFTIIAYDLSAPIFTAPRGAPLRFLGLVLALKNSFVDGYARIFSFSVSKTYEVDFNPVLAQIPPDRYSDYNIVLADGPSTEFVVRTFQDFLVDRRLLFMDVIKNVKGRFLLINETGHVSIPNKNFAAILGEDTIFIQPHLIRQRKSYKLIEQWKSPRMIMLKIRHNSAFSNNVQNKVIRLIRALQVVSQTTYEYRYIKIPPILSRADRLCEVQQILNQLGLSLPTYKDIPLGLLG